MSTGAVEHRRVLQHPTTVLANTSMNENAISGLQNSGTVVRLRQALSNLQIASLTEGDPTCQACGEVIPQADPVTLYLSRPAGRPGYHTDQFRCIDHHDDLTGLFTLGKRELVVDGRIGQRRNRAIQQAQSVLVNPSISLISEADTKSGRRISDHPDGHSHTDHPARNRTSTEAIQEQANCTALHDSPNPITVQSIGGRQ